MLYGIRAYLTRILVLLSVATSARLPLLVIHYEYELKGVAFA